MSAPREQKQEEHVAKAKKSYKESGWYNAFSIALDRKIAAYKEELKEKGHISDTDSDDYDYSHSEDISDEEDDDE